MNKCNMHVLEDDIAVQSHSTCCDSDSRLVWSRDLRASHSKLVINNNLTRTQITPQNTHSRSEKSTQHTRAAIPRRNTQPLLSMSYTCNSTHTNYTLSWNSLGRDESHLLLPTLALERNLRVEVVLALRTRSRSEPHEVKVAAVAGALRTRRWHQQVSVHV